MLHVSLIGCGRWGRNILRDLLSLGCEVAVADPAVEARRRALAAGAQQAFETIRELPLSVKTGSAHRCLVECTIQP